MFAERHGCCMERSNVARQASLSCAFKIFVPVAVVVQPVDYEHIPVASNLTLKGAAPGQVRTHFSLEAGEPRFTSSEFKGHLKSQVDVAAKADAQGTSDENRTTSQTPARSARRTRQ